VFAQDARNGRIQPLRGVAAVQRGIAGGEVQIGELNDFQAG